MRRSSERQVSLNSIFQDELYSLYQRKDISYKELTAQARASMRELVRQMENTVCDSPVIETLMLQLAHELKTVSGKKVYGYLKKPLKEQVDAIVDELAKVPAVAECYEVWNNLRDELESYYKDKPRQRLPLSQQKEFKAIKNMVIREADGGAGRRGYQRPEIRADYERWKAERNARAKQEGKD